MELHVSLKIRTSLHLSQPHIDHYPPARLASESLTLILDPEMSYTPGPELQLAVAPWPHRQKSYCIHIAVEHPRTTYVHPSYRRCHSEHLPSPPPSVLPGSSLSRVRQWDNVAANIALLVPHQPVASAFNRRCHISLQHIQRRFPRRVRHRCCCWPAPALHRVAGEATCADGLIYDICMWVRCCRRARRRR